MGCTARLKSKKLQIIPAECTRVPMILMIFTQILFSSKVTLNLKGLNTTARTIEYSF
jgi:hypothetical protein